MVFSTNAPNGADVTTELLLQPVGSLHSKGTPALFRTKGFHTFTSGSLSGTVAVPSGCYACAVRFVRPSTGQSSALVPVGTVRV